MSTLTGAARGRRLVAVVVICAAALVVSSAAVAAKGAVRIQHVADFAWTQATPEAVDARAHFHVLLPSVIPPGYKLQKIVVPRQLISAPDYRASSEFALVVYVNPALQPPGYRQPADDVASLPSQALQVLESPSQRPAGASGQAYPGAPLTVDVGGRPGVYFDSAARSLGGGRYSLDASQDILIVEQAGTRAVITGYKSGGVDRGALQSIAGSLREPLWARPSPLRETRGARPAWRTAGAANVRMSGWLELVGGWLAGFARLVGLAISALFVASEVERASCPSSMMRIPRTRAFLVAGVASAAIAASLVFLTGASSVLGPRGSCRTQAEPMGYSGSPPLLECFATPEEAATGTIFGGDERQVRGANVYALRVSAPVAIADAGKPYCAAMLVNPYTKGVRAQCFDSVAEQVEATRGWQAVSVPERAFRWDGTPTSAR